jgi:hypothetical protein
MNNYIIQFDEKQLDQTLRQISIIGEQRKKTLASLRQALIDNDQVRVNYYAKVICGLENESNRISASINSGTSG